MSFVTFGMEDTIIKAVLRAITTRLCVVAVLLLAVANTAHAQVFEFEIGGGHVFRGAPAVPIVGIGAAVWPTEHWGVAGRFVRGLGEDSSGAVRIQDRTFLGTGDLRAWTITGRYRLPDIGLELGAGIADRRYESIQIWHFREPAERHTIPEGDASLDGLTLEAFYTRSLAPHFAIKAGIGYDAWIDGTDYVRPVLLASIWP